MPEAGKLLTWPLSMALSVTLTGAVPDPVFGVVARVSGLFAMVKGSQSGV